MAKAVAASAAFDVFTLTQTRNGASAKAIARGWHDGLRGMAAERRTLGASERATAARRLVSFGEALREQRRLERL
jgi:hypothetical protein